MTPEDRKHSDMVQQLGTGYSGERGGLIDPAAYHENVSSKIERTVSWDATGLKVTRLRLLSDPGFPAWDVSYCHGELDGQPVEVMLPFSQLPKRGVSRAIVAHAKCSLNAAPIGLAAITPTRKGKQNDDETSRLDGPLWPPV